MEKCVACGVELALLTNSTNGYCKKCDPTLQNIAPEELEPLAKPKYSQKFKQCVSQVYLTSFCLAVVCGAAAYFLSGDSVNNTAIVATLILGGLSAIAWTVRQLISDKHDVDPRKNGPDGSFGGGMGGGF